MVDFNIFLRSLKVPVKLVGSRLIEPYVFTSFLLTGFIVSYIVFPSSLVSVFYAIPAWFFLSVAVYLLNDLSDEKIDKWNELDKPLVNKSVSKTETAIVILGFISFSLILSATVNAVYFLLCLSSLALGILYSVPPFRIKKRLGGKQFTLGMGTILSLLAGGGILGTFPPILFFVVLLISPTMFVMTSIADLRDMTGDGRAGCRTVAICLGSKRTLDLGIIGFLVMLALIVPGYIYFNFNLLFFPIIVTICALNIKNYFFARNSTSRVNKYRNLIKFTKVSFPVIQVGIIIGLL